ncbi:MAG: glycosyltransferase [Phycisphaerae bacterium]|nr:glycosyltransferase [Phycisphaerae bacterium]
MAITPILLGLYVFLALLYWLWSACCAVRLRRAVPLLANLEPPPPDRWPKLSVVVPARNEADTLEPAVRTLLGEDYPDLEIILVDDRSSDETGRIIDRIAAGDARVKAVHITELREGWLGKVNALDRGLGKSSGRFVLFTDADVHFRTGTLQKAIAYCEQQGLDHLAAFPDVWSAGFIVDAMISVFLRHFLFFVSRACALDKVASRAFLGVGAFNLVRRKALEATDGFEWLRLEVADDMGLGLMMKRSGARCGAVAAFGHVGLYWYHSVAQAARGTEKAWATLSHFSVVRTFAIALVTLAVEMSPVLSLLPLATERLRAIGYVGLGVFVAFVFCVVHLSRWAKVRAVPALAAPLAVLPLAIIFIRAAMIGRRRGGVVWRGTLYRAETLRKHMRVKLP